MSLYRVVNKLGVDVAPGASVDDFRGVPAVFAGVGRAPEYGRAAKIYVEGRLGWFNASVFGLEVWQRVEVAGPGGERERAWLTSYPDPFTVAIQLDDDTRAVMAVSSARVVDEL